MLVDHTPFIDQIFRSLDPSTFKLTARETSQVEFKENFNWANKDKYVRSMASFANNRGGYLVFGIANKPRIFTGLQSNNFEDLDEAEISGYLNGLLSPEIEYEKFVVEKNGRKAGILYTYSAGDKPIIAIKNDGSSIKEAEIYYRYNARNDKIKYSELKSLFDQTREKETERWMKLFERVSKIGLSSAAIMDITHGTIEGEKNTLLIDKDLIPKLKFIKEGQFSETGKPTLKLIGDVRPISVSAARPVAGELRLTDDPSAPAVREEAILKAYPLDYSQLVKELLSRYSDLKLNNAFYRLKKEIGKNTKFCRSRYLDPKNPNSSRKDYYSKSIIKEFDKHYTKK